MKSLGTKSSIKKCSGCGQNFEDHGLRQNAIWCSDVCRNRHNRSLKKMNKEGIMKKELVDVKEFTEAMLKGLKDTPRLIKLPPKRNMFTGKIHESAVLLLSDIHCGQVNKFLNVATNKMEVTFNTGTCDCILPNSIFASFSL
jgi:hypothetical protein